MLNYYIWDHHGELPIRMGQSLVMQFERMIDDMPEMLTDLFRIGGMEDPVEEEGQQSNVEPPNEDIERIKELVKDANEALHEGCQEFTKLSFLVRLFHIKCLGGWSNKTFAMLLEALRLAIPGGQQSIPKSFYEAKKVIRELGLSYNKIDACPNDCMLYWKTKINKEACDRCGVSRWQSNTKIEEDAINSETQQKSRKVPCKVLRHFPLIPRLQRLYMTSIVAKEKVWHHEERVNDGLLHHPVDAEAWKDFDRKYPEFSSDPRNIKLGLASDGFNPFGTMNITHSTWPVIVMPYNLPPWLCMKKPHFIMSLLIPGPSSPSNNIDIYLEPLIDETQFGLAEVGNAYDRLTSRQAIGKVVVEI